MIRFVILCSVIVFNEFWDLTLCSAVEWFSTGRDTFEMLNACVSSCVSVILCCVLAFNDPTLWFSIVFAVF